MSLRAFEQGEKVNGASADLYCDVGEMHPVLSITLEVHPKVALKAAHAW